MTTMIIADADADGTDPPGHVQAPCQLNRSRLTGYSGASYPFCFEFVFPSNLPPSP